VSNKISDIILYIILSHKKHVYNISNMYTRIRRCVYVCVKKFKKHIYGFIYIFVKRAILSLKIQFDQKNFFLVLNCRYFYFS